MKKFHDKYGTGHRSAESTVHLILRSGYYWPTVFKDAQHHVRTCFICQTSANKERNLAMPLQPVYEIRPFAKWGLDFIGPINPPSSTGHRFILTTTDYCTRWIEAETFWNCTTQVVIGFLENHIIMHFNMPFFLVCDNGSSFASLILTQWALENQVIIKFSSNYYP